MDVDQATELFTFGFIKIGMKLWTTSQFNGELIDYW